MSGDLRHSVIVTYQAVEICYSLWNLLVTGCSFSQLEHVSVCGCFVTGEVPISSRHSGSSLLSVRDMIQRNSNQGSSDGCARSRSARYLPKSSRHSGSSSSSVRDMIQRNSNQGSSDGCARLRGARCSVQKNCTCDKWERIWCSRSSSGLIPTLKISRRCSRHCRNSASSCQPVNQSKQHTLPNKSSGKSFKSHGHVMESRSAARRSSHSSECARSDSNRCYYGNVREASVSHMRQWYQSNIANKSIGDSEMSAKKHASSSINDRSRKIPRFSSDSSECERSGTNRCHYGNMRDVSVSREREWYQSDIANRSRCESEMLVKKRTNSSGYDRSRQILLSEQYSGNFSHTHVAAVNHSFSQRSANVTIRKRSWQYSGSHISASGSKNRMLERSSTRNWQQIATYIQDPARRPQPLLSLPPVPYLPSSLNVEVPWTFTRLFPFFVPFVFLPAPPIPVPVWRWRQPWY